MKRARIEMRPGDVGEHTQVRVTMELTEAASPWQVVDLCAALESWPGVGGARVVWSAAGELEWLGEWTRAVVEAAVHAEVEVHEGPRARDR